MAVQMNFERDKLFDELGLMRLRESYMRSSEKSPQERFAFVAETFGSNPEHAQRIYDYASRHWLSFSTPILSFGRSKKGLPISCFLTYMEDSAEGLVDTLSEVNWLSMLGGGVVAMAWFFGGKPFDIEPLWPAAIVCLVILIPMTLMSKEKVSPGYLRYQEAVREMEEEAAAERAR